MKKILITSTLILILTGCGVDLSKPSPGLLSWYENTAPGAALPSSTGFETCKEMDMIGRCKDWSQKSETCVNPLGLNANPPIMPCADIKKR